jgi:hypothetical protein
MIETSGPLSRRERSFLRLAVRLAESSEVEPFKHGCVVVSSGSVLGLGINKDRNCGSYGLGKDVRSRQEEVLYT